MDMKTYLQEFLMKQDQMSMAASIESRVPFLDHKLVEFAASLPVKMKLRGLTTKYILRRAMRDRLPKAILTRKKMGFPVPVGAWLRGKFGYILDEYVLSPRALGREAWRIADDLGWAKTYDAEYLALASLLGCRFVTLDARMRRGADRLGFVVSPSEL